MATGVQTATTITRVTRSLRAWPGRVISGGGAAILLVSLYLPWYSTTSDVSGRPLSTTAWEAFRRDDELLVALAVLTLWATSVRFSRLTLGARGVAGVAAAALVVLRIVSPPGHGDSILIGPLVALAAAVAMAFAAAIDLRNLSRLEATAPAVRATPGLADSGAAVYQAGEVRAARVESLRAIAALSVVGLHVFIISEAKVSDPLNHFLNGGAFGVFFFLTLTGYLLFRPFARHFVDGRSGLRLREYAVNRALRILPLYYVVVAVLLVLRVNGGEPHDWWRFALFLENFSFGTVLRADSPMWSLPVEIQFYVFLPLLALLIGWIARGSRARAAAVIAAVAIPSLVLRLIFFSFNPAPDFRWTFSLPTLFFFFAAGMLLALLRLAWDEQRPRWVRGPLASADLWMLASAPLWIAALADKRFQVAVAPAAFLILAGCVLPLRAGVLARALDWRPLAVLGIASYSLYLWHVPAITLVADNPVRFPPPGGVFTGRPHELLYLGVAAFPACIAVALASYAIIESPFLRLRRQWASRPGRKPRVSGTAEVTSVST